MNERNDNKISTTDHSSDHQTDLPRIASRQPAFVKLTKGQRYFWCTCGLSNSQPFCDGMHKGTKFSPQKYVAGQDKEVFLCQCKHTKKAPFCDGSHSQVPCRPRDKSE